MCSRGSCVIFLFLKELEDAGERGVLPWWHVCVIIDEIGHHAFTWLASDFKCYCLVSTYFSQP
jgi:hypothetical protein